MKSSSLLCLLALVAPLVAFPKYESPYTKKPWPSAWSGVKPIKKYPEKPKHHHHSATGGKLASHRSSGNQPPYPTMSASGGYNPPGGVDGTGFQAPIQTTAPKHRYQPPGHGPAATGARFPKHARPEHPSGGGGGGGVKPSAVTPPNTSTSGSTLSSGGVSLPPKCEQKNNIGIGWLPGDGVTLQDITNILGVQSCFDGEYAQITETGTYTDSKQQLQGALTQIPSGQTIFIASIMPTIPMASVDSTVAAGVATVLEQFTNKKIEVWLRFAHEMNYYATPNSQGGHYIGNANDFQSAWSAISAAVSGNSMIKMYWSPNEASSADLKSGGWYPKNGKVDIVGIDIYPKKQQTFADTYADFCGAFSSSTIPFVIGETAAGPDLKEYWLGQLSSAEAKQACPHYLGFSWFEYNKEQDFRVVTNGETIASRLLG